MASQVVALIANSEARGLRKPSGCRARSFTTAGFGINAARTPTSLLTLFRSDKKRDFASGAGEDLLASKVRQALLTEGATPKSSGELPWRTSFGSGLHVLRHLRNDAALSDLARVHVRDCLKRWVPEAELVEVTATRDGAVLQLKVRFRAAKDAGKAATTEEEQISFDG